jgi:transcriptional regulator with XRE-family HTH domain
MTTKWYERAHALMKDGEISRVRVGQALGVTPQSVSLKLSGQRPTSVDEISVIAGVLGVSAAELVAEDAEYVSSLDEVELVKLFRLLNPDQKASILNMMRSFVGT